VSAVASAHSEYPRDVVVRLTDCVFRFLQALALLPEMTPSKPIVNKNQLAVISMWLCGIPC